MERLVWLEWHLCFRSCSIFRLAEQVILVLQLCIGPRGSVLRSCSDDIFDLLQVFEDRLLELFERDFGQVLRVVREEKRVYVEPNYDGSDFTI